MRLMLILLKQAITERREQPSSGGPEPAKVVTCPSFKPLPGKPSQDRCLKHIASLPFVIRQDHTKRRLFPDLI